MRTLNNVKYIAISAVASLILAGCGGSGSSSTTTASVTAPVSGTTISGTAIDPELQGANVYLDANDNGKYDVGELNTTTDKFGKYSLVIPETDIGKSIIAEGGVDKVTKEDFKGKLIAITTTKGEQFITPLTTLVKKYHENDTNKSIEEVRAEVATKLGLANTDDLDKDILTDNNLLQIALRVNKVAQKVAGVSGKEIEDIYKNIAQKLSQTDFNSALQEAIDDDVDKTSLEYDKVVDLEKELRNIDNKTLNAEEFALTVDNIDRNITAAKSRVELEDDLFDDEKMIISDATEAKAFRDIKVLERLGYKDLDEATKAKLIGNPELDFEDDLLSDLKEKISKNQIGLDAEDIKKLDREDLFNESAVKDLSKEDKEKLKAKFDGEGFDFSKASKDDFEKKLKESATFTGLSDDLRKELEDRFPDNQSTKHEPKQTDSIAIDETDANSSDSIAIDETDANLTDTNTTDSTTTDSTTTDSTTTDSTTTDSTTTDSTTSTL